MNREENGRDPNCNMSRRNNDKKTIHFHIFAILMIATPLILAGIVACFYAIRDGVVPVPGMKWNDEAQYYQLIKTTVETGSPVGYWGFNGNHAIVGTGGAWSPAIIWPYAVFAYLFPMSKGLVYFVNLFYITAANVIFYLCVKPGKGQCIKLALAQATSVLFIVYLSVNMSEIFRYGVAIVLAGLLYQMMFRESPKIVKYVIAPVAIIGAVQIYTFFAFCVPIYVFALMKKNKLWQKLLVSAASMGVVAVGSYYLLHLISSNYNIHKTETLLNAVKSLDIPGAVMAFLRMMKQGMTDVFHLWTYVYSYPMIPFQVLLGIVLVAVSVVLLAIFLYKRNRKKETCISGHDAVIACVTVYSIILFYLMYMTLYSIDPFTFVRGTYIVVIFCMYLMAMCEHKWLYRGILIFQAVGLLFLPATMDYYMTGHYTTAEEDAQWKELEADVALAVQADESLGPWENTIAMYTMEPKAICALPAGMGVNFIMEDGVLPEEAGYLFLSVIPAEKQSSEWIVRDYGKFLEQYGEVLESEYSVVYEDGSYIIYRRK